MSNLFARAKVTYCAVSDDVLASDDAAQLVIDAGYKQNSLSVVAHIFDEQ